MKHPLLLLLLVAVAGCRMEAKEPVTEYGMSSKPGALVRPARYDTAYAGSREAFLDSLRVQSDRADAQAMSDLGIPQKDAAAKVAVVMAANDITLPQVAAYLGTYGLDVVQQSAWRRVHFAPAPDAYWYEHELRFADGDTAFEFQLRGVVDQARAFDRVRGVMMVNGTPVYGPWSEVGHDDKAALPGIGEYE